MLEKLYIRMRTDAKFRRKMDIVFDYTYKVGMAMLIFFVLAFTIVLVVTFFMFLNKIDVTIATIIIAGLIALLSTLLNTYVKTYLENKNKKMNLHYSDKKELYKDIIENLFVCLEKYKDTSNIDISNFKLFLKLNRTTIYNIASIEMIWAIESFIIESTMNVDRNVVNRNALKIVGIGKKDLGTAKSSLTGGRLWNLFTDSYKQDGE